MSARRHDVELARAAIQRQPPYDVRRETRWQYHERLATAAVDALTTPKGTECTHS